MIQRNKQIQTIHDKYARKRKELAFAFPNAGGTMLFHEAELREIIALNLPPDPLCSNAYKNAHEADSWFGDLGYCGHCYCKAQYMNLAQRSNNAKSELNADYNYIFSKIKFFADGETLENIMGPVNAPVDCAYSVERVYEIVKLLVENKKLELRHGRYYVGCGYEH